MIQSKTNPKLHNSRIEHFLKNGKSLKHDLASGANSGTVTSPSSRKAATPYLNALKLDKITSAANKKGRNLEL